VDKSYIPPFPAASIIVPKMVSFLNSSWEKRVQTELSVTHFSAESADPYQPGAQRQGWRTGSKKGLKTRPKKYGTGFQPFFDFSVHTQRCALGWYIMRFQRSPCLYNGY
jgi:hypothetical protein